MKREAQLRFGGGLRDGAVGQAACRAVVFEDFKRHFGAQHEHAQAFDHGFGEVGGEHQQEFAAGVGNNHIGDDAAFGGVVGGVAGFAFGEGFDVVGELAVQEGGAVVAGGADDGEKGQKRGVHGESLWAGQKGGVL